MNGIIGEKEIRERKEKFQPGNEVVLVRMGKDDHPIASGTHGTVYNVDDFGVIHVTWHEPAGDYDLGMLPDFDEVVLVA